jgi:hypothetical protein
VDPDPAELAAALIEAINSRDPAALERLLGPGSEVQTGRSVHSGPDAVLRWAAREYDNLVKRYEVEELRARAGRVLALGSVQYVWKEGGEVADSSPIALEMDFSGGRLGRLSLHDDSASAVVAFDA